MTPMEAPSTPAAATSWSGAFGIFKLSREAVRRSLATLLLLSFIGAMSDPLIYLIRVGTNQQISSIATFVLYLLIIPFQSGAGTYTLIQSVRGRSVEPDEAFKVALRLFPKVLLLSVFLYFIAFISTLLLIIPVFFVMPRLVLAPYFLVDQRLGVIDACKVSWKATKGNVAKVWGIFGAALVMILPIFTIIGIPVAIYLLFMYGGCLALLYQYVIDGHHQATK